MATKQVIVMRTDLNMRKGKMVAQGAHASMKWLTDMMKGDPHCEFALTEEEADWVNGPFVKICVGAKSLDELMAVFEDASRAGLTVRLITDNGTTEFGGVKTITCLAIGPHQAEKIDPITGHLGLI